MYNLAVSSLPIYCSTYDPDLHEHERQRNVAQDNPKTSYYTKINFNHQAKDFAKMRNYIDARAINRSIKLSVVTYQFHCQIAGKFSSFFFKAVKHFSFTNDANAKFTRDRCYKILNFSLTIVNNYETFRLQLEFCSETSYW